MRRFAVALAALLAAFAMPVTAAVAAGDVSIRSVDVDEFPTVRLVVSTRDSVAFDLRDVVIVENETAVEVTDVYGLGAESGRIDAVLAIDVSNSMRGRPLRTALAASRTFLTGVPASMPLGVILFADTPEIVSPVTADRASVEQAVAAIGASTSQGTALFDTVVAAATMFDESTAAQHNLILVTDGRNTSDGTQLEDAVAAAQTSDLHVFTVGLAGAGTDETTLQTLARETDGEYAAIAPDQLTTVYAGLAEQFTRQHVVEYRSKSPLGSTVTVDLRLPFGSATHSFLAPGHSALRTNQATRAISFWAQPAGMAVVAGLTFVAMFSMGLIALEVQGRRRRIRQLRSGLGPQVEAAWDADRSAGGTPSPLIPRQMADVAERVAAGTSAGRQLARRIEHAGWAIRSGEFLWIVVVVVVVLTVIGYVAANIVGALAGAFVGALAPFAFLSHAASRRQSAIQAQLADTLMVIASAMRAGHSFMQSLDSAAKEVDEPAAGEFGRVLSEIRLGRETEGALDSLVERIGSQDLEWAVTAIKIQRKIGGNLSEVLETVAKTIRERETVRRQVKVLSAEGRISILVLTVLPILLAGYIMIVNPEYLKTLTTTTPGIALSVSGSVLLVIGYVWMKKIVRLDV